jgi:hypothetical protein
MSFAAAERLARTLLFEGYILYPYRRSSLKNVQRWMFGSLYPPAFCRAASANDASTMQTECLLVGTAPRVRVSVRFLQLVARSDAEARPWQEGIERRVEVAEHAVATLCRETVRLDLNFTAETPGESSALCAEVELAGFALGPELWKLRVSIHNQTPIGAESDRTAASLRALVSTHMLLGCRDAHFVSLLEPAAGLESHAASCDNQGCWPVLVGDGADTMLSSPIILYDHPSVARQSAGDLFDATEIDEILSLRILTLTQAERREVMQTDPRARALLERTEALRDDALIAMHGGSSEEPQPSAADRARLRPGDRVLVRPRANGDVLDLVLAGERATIASLEEDFEGRLHYVVTIDADPGRDLGLLGQPGHRFFFSEDELEAAP